MTQQIIKASGGTVLSGSANIPNSISFASNNANNTSNPSLKAYLDPDGSPWTNTTIDSMQVGQKVTAVGTNKVSVTTIWVYVDYTPAVGGVANTSNFFLMF